ncbi:MAG: TolC family protein [Candidatus Riflebacteria bacterium]|nr:TolC family protein [Candidatus Riflebacteria bacterium]
MNPNFNFSLYSKWITICLFFFVFTGPILFADDVEPASMALSLTDALKIALEQSPSIHESILGIAKTQADRKIAKSALKPSLNANVFQQREKLNYDTFLGTPGENGAYIVGPYTWGRLGVSANVPLFDLTLWNRWKATEHIENSAKAKARMARESICALVVGQYLGAQRAAESVKAAQSRVELAETLEKIASDQQKNNVGTKIDTLRAGVQLRNERQRLIRSQAQLQIAIFGLVKLLNLEPSTKLELTDPLSTPDLPQFNFHNACEFSFKQRPELSSLDFQEKATLRAKKSAQSQRLPSLVLAGSYISTGLFHQAFVPVGEISLGLQMPVFNGGRISAEVKKTSIDLNQIREEKRDLKAQVCFEIQVAETEIETSQSEVEVASEAVSLASDELVQARHRFEAGITSNIDVVNAQDEFARATDNKIDALFHLNQARANLAKALGWLEPLFLDKGDTDDGKTRRDEFFGRKTETSK